MNKKTLFIFCILVILLATAVGATLFDKCAQDSDCDTGYVCLTDIEEVLPAQYDSAMGVYIKQEPEVTLNRCGPASINPCKPDVFEGVDPDKTNDWFCMNDVDCLKGRYCDGGICEVADRNCRTNKDCSDIGKDFFCDTTTEKCVNLYDCAWEEKCETFTFDNHNYNICVPRGANPGDSDFCQNDSHCSGSYVCADYECRMPFCNSYTDCGPNQVCSDGVCRSGNCGQLVTAPVACESFEDCGLGLVCLGGTCYPPTTSPECVAEWLPPTGILTCEQTTFAGKHVPGTTECSVSEEKSQNICCCRDTSDCPQGMECKGGGYCASGIEGPCEDDRACDYGLSCYENDKCYDSEFGSMGLNCTVADDCVGNTECLQIKDSSKFQCAATQSCPEGFNIINGYCQEDADSDTYCPVEQYENHECLFDCDDSSNLCFGPEENCASADKNDSIECTSCDSLTGDLRVQCDNLLKNCDRNKGNFTCKYSDGLSFLLGLLTVASEDFECSLKSLPDCRDWCVDVDGDGWCSYTSRRFINKDFYDEQMANEKDIQGFLDNYEWKLVSEVEEFGEYFVIEDTDYLAKTEGMISGFLSAGEKEFFECSSCTSRFINKSLLKIQEKCTFTDNYFNCSDLQTLLTDTEFEASVNDTVFNFDLTGDELIINKGTISFLFGVEASNCLDFEFNNCIQTDSDSTQCDVLNHYVTCDRGETREEIKQQYKEILEFDCDDSNENVHPTASETATTCRENLDGDCDGLYGIDDDDCFILGDKDGDGDIAVEFGGFDCNDSNAAINLSAPDNTNDDIDNNCNGLFDEQVDEDGDGFYDAFEQEGCVEDHDVYPSGALRNTSGCIDIPDWNWRGIAYIVTDETSRAHSNDLTIKKVLVVQNKSGVWQVVNMNASREYTFSFYYKGTGSVVFGEDGFFSESLSSDNWERFSITMQLDELFPNKVSDFENQFQGYPLIQLMIDFITDTNEELRIDGVMFEEAPEPTSFIAFDKDVSCCPQDYCWTGEKCIHDDEYELNISKPPLAGFAEDGLCGSNGYRCINGSWTFSRFKWDPIMKSGGYCPEDDQCFLDQQRKCINSGEYDTFAIEQSDGFSVEESFYCYEGNWSTRTKAIALELLEIPAGDDDFTLFCDKFEFALNYEYDESFVEILLRGSGININTQSLPFKQAINEFCVLNLKKEDGNEIYAGISLNIDINETIKGEDYSMIQLIKGPDEADYCNELSGEEGFRACKFQDVLYNPDLQSVLFTKSDKSVTTVTPNDIFSRALNALRNLLERLGLVGGVVEVNKLFVESAGHFDKIYMSQQEDNGRLKTINAIRETRFDRGAVGNCDEPDTDDATSTVMSVEYNNYILDMCKFTSDISAASMQSYITDELDYACKLDILDESNWVHTVLIKEPTIDNDFYQAAADNVWNDLTAKTRSQLTGIGPVSTSQLSDELAVTPSTGFVGSVSGTVFTFNLTSIPEGAKTLTFNFGDGSSESRELTGTETSFDVTHDYKEKGVYPASVFVMFKDHSIGVTADTYVFVTGIEVNLISPDLTRTQAQDLITFNANVTYETSVFAVATPLIQQLPSIQRGAVSDRTPAGFRVPSDLPDDYIVPAVIVPPVVIYWDFGSDGNDNTSFPNEPVKQLFASGVHNMTVTAQLSDGTKTEKFYRFRVIP